jgi:putative PIN family toxin of toxin-antitoxin system
VPNVVVDANTVASAALKAESQPETALIFALIHDSLYLSEPVLDEIREVLSRPKFRRYVGEERLAEILALMLGYAHFVTPMTNVRACRDPADDKYLDLALAADAHAIVTGDHDLLSMSPWRGIRIINAAEYVALIAAREHLAR